MAMVWYEIKKILVRPSCQIALLILLVLAGRSCYQVIAGTESTTWVNEEGQIETGYAAMQKLRDAQKEWSGVLNQELLEEALAELKRIQNLPPDPYKDDVTNGSIVYHHGQKLKMIRDLMNWGFKTDYGWRYEDYFLAETVEPEQIPYFYTNRITQLQHWLYDESGTAFSRFSETEKQYLIHNYETLEVPFRVGYTKGWEKAFTASYYLILWGSIIMAFLVSGIFANESRWKADSIYFSTEHGRKKGTMAKLAAGFLLTTAVYWGILLTINLFILSYMGFDGANCPLQADFHYWKSIYNITFLQRSVLALADGYLLWMFIAALVMLASAMSSSLSLSVTVPSLLMLAPNILDTEGYVSETSKIIRLLPNKITTAYGNESIMLYSVFNKVFTPITIQRLLYSCLAVSFVILAYQGYRRKQIQ